MSGTIYTRRIIEAILKANTVKGNKLKAKQYSDLLRRVKDQDRSAPYVGADFTEYQ